MVLYRNTSAMDMVQRNDLIEAEGRGNYRTEKDIEIVDLFERH